MSAVAIIRPNTFGELMQFATMAAKSTMVPVQYKGKPDDIVLAIQLGSELGLAPMQSLQNVAVINGRPTVYGDAMLALVRQSGACQDVQERMEGDGDGRVAICTAMRKGATPVQQRFSVQDAKRAGLWGKGGPWTQYPDRMLQMRARGFALRDAFPDILKGLISSEEAADIPTPVFAGPTVDVKPEPVVEVAPKRKTTREWLDEIEAAFYLCDTNEEVQAVILRDDVQTALTKLTNGALEALKEMIMHANRDATTEEEVV